MGNAHTNTTEASAMDGAKLQTLMNAARGPWEAEAIRLRAINTQLVAANALLMVRENEARELFSLAHSALTECEAILGGEYGDHYGPLAETMTELHMRIEDGAWLAGSTRPTPIKDAF